MDETTQLTETEVNTYGFKSIFDLLAQFPDEQTCIDHLERLRWDGNVISPFDADSKVYKCKNNKYRCRNTGKYFNVKTGTIFEDTKIPLQKWFMALYVFSSHKKGISSHQLAKDIDVTQKTAWFLLHRLRYAFGHPNFKQALSGNVEADETYVGGKEKNKHKSKKNKQIYGSVGKTTVLGAVERGGRVIAMKANDATMINVVPFVFDNVIAGSKLYTDENRAYYYVSDFYDHQTISHRNQEYVRDKVYTNTIEGFWSYFKRGVDGIYHWVSDDHLQSYLDEYSLRYSTRTNTTCQRFDLILSNVIGRLTYKQLISNE